MCRGSVGIAAQRVTHMVDMSDIQGDTRRIAEVICATIAGVKIPDGGSMSWDMSSIWHRRP